MNQPELVILFTIVTSLNILKMFRLVFEILLYSPVKLFNILLLVYSSAFAYNTGFW